MSGKLMDAEQMSEALAARPNKRLRPNYKEESDQHKGEMLSRDIREKAAALQTTVCRERVDLRDLAQVQERTFQYLEACSASEVYPSVMTLAVYAYGISRQRLNGFLRENPDSPTTHFVEMTKDVIADILVNQSLYRNADSVQAIFQLKNHAGHTDRVEIDARPAIEPLGALPDQTALEEKLGDVVIEDDWSD